jgi:hypothetical protein
MEDNQPLCAKVMRKKSTQLLHHLTLYNLMPISLEIGGKKSPHQVIKKAHRGVCLLRRRSVHVQFGYQERYEDKYVKLNKCVKRHKTPRDRKG